MRTWWKAVVITLAALIAGATTILAQTTSPASAPATQAASHDAVVIVFKGEVDEFNKDDIIRRFAQARKLGADTVILQINTYGGLVTAGLEFSQFLKRQNDLHVIAFIDEKAISAGSMIALACNEIVMEPGSKLGDCAPISVTSGGELQTMGPAERAKIESPILQDFDESASRNGYNRLLVQSMVSVGKSVYWIQNAAGQRKFVDQADYTKLKSEGWSPVEGVPDPIDADTTLFTTGPELALKLGLAKAIEPSPQALAAARGMTILATLEPSFGDIIMRLLSSNEARALFTSVFLFAIYIAFSHPGHGMAEVLAVVSLGLLVGVPLLTGYAQWWEVALIFLGLFLLAVEIFVIPGFGVTGISGIILLIAGLVLSWVGAEPIGMPGILPKLPGTWQALQNSVVIVVIGMACSLLLWFWLQRYLPKLPYFNKLILTTTSGSVPVVDSRLDGAVEAIVWPPLGSRGRAMTDLRPGGTAAFHDAELNDVRMTDVISDSGFVRAGTDLVVREVQGTRVIVRAVS